MAYRSHQADELDFLLGSTLHADVPESSHSNSTWIMIRRRIETHVERPKLHITFGTMSYLAPREWTLDWQIMSMARLVR